MFNKKKAKKIYSLLIKCYGVLKDLDVKIDDMFNNPVKKRREEEPTRYIHIGYPKSASTAIQKGYMGRHN